MTARAVIPTLPALTDDSPVSRDDALAAIRSALRVRSGRAWSVRGGRGTSWGWLTITAPPSRLDFHGAMTPGDCAELARLLGLGAVDGWGVLIQPDPASYREYVARAARGTA